jgi:protein-L-isoaspartate(D-aspartate) O-methyltransferase
MKAEALEPTYFVPMTGRAEELRRLKEDTGVPVLVNGSFESTFGEGGPAGWYYARQASVVSDPSAPDGQQVLRFRNDTPGRGAQALQSVALDGRRVRRLDVSLWVKTSNCRAGLSAEQLPHLELVLFNEQRSMIGTRTLGPWRGSSGWAKKRLQVKVPREARLAGVAVGMSGATGQLSIDHLRIEAANVSTP